MCKCAEYKEHIINFGCTIISLLDHVDQVLFFFLSLSYFSLASADSSLCTDGSLNWPVIHF